MSVTGWIGDHILGPVFGPTLGIGNLSPRPNENVGGVNLATGQRVNTGNRSDNSGPYQPQPQQAPLGTTAVGKPFAGFGPWLVGFGAFAAVVAFASDSPTWRPLALAILGLVIASYMFASWSTFVDEANLLFGTSFAGGSQ